MTVAFTGTTINSVSITATSASLTLGTAVTSSTGMVTGSYNSTTKAFSLTLNSLQISISSFVNISATTASVNYNGAAAGSTMVTLAAGGSPVAVSLLTVGITGANIFAGVNGPASNSGAVGVSLTGANFSLALMSASSGTTYYAVSATASMLAGVGLPADITVGVGSLNVQINGSSDGTDAVNFAASFPTTGLTVPGSSLSPLDFTQSLIQVSGSLTLNVTNYIQISGGFDFTQTAGVVDITVGAAAFTGATALTFSLGSAASPFFSATGGVSLSFDSTTFTVISASLTVNTDIKIASVLEVDGLSVSLSNLAINLATGAVAGTVSMGVTQGRW